MVAFWRGTWDFGNLWYSVNTWHVILFYQHSLRFDKILFSENLNLSNAVALLSGIVLNFAIDMFHTSIRDLAGTPGSWRHVVGRHVYSVVYGVLDILLWKGVWDGYDHYAGHGPLQAVLSLSLGVITLLATRTIKTAWSMPVSRYVVAKYPSRNVLTHFRFLDIWFQNGIVVDRPEDHISADTFWHSEPGDNIKRLDLTTLSIQAAHVTLSH